jgi:hypothetical protein
MHGDGWFEETGPASALNRLGRAGLASLLFKRSLPRPDAGSMNFPIHFIPCTMTVNDHFFTGFCRL